jgi:type IV fimbrial biogenesis protein FimT
MKMRGFTLVELLAVLAIAGVLLALAFPALESRAPQERATAALNQLIGAIAFARSAAVLHGAPVTFCPGTAGACLGRDQWHRGALVFRDRNRNGSREPDETLLSALPGLHQGARVYWRAFRSRSYLRFLPAGYTEWQNGHFLYCPASGDPTLARMLILNAQGRTRVAGDTDGDGIAEDARGHPLSCP